MNITDVDSMNHSGFANNFNSTLSDVDSMNHTGFANNLTFQDVITNPFYYGSSITFIFLLLFVISIIIFIENINLNFYWQNQRNSLEFAFCTQSWSENQSSIVHLWKKKQKNYFDFLLYK